MSSPFTDIANDQIRSLGERQLIKHIRDWLGECAPPSPFGMGDDTAVLKEPSQNLLTTDSLVFGRHFDASLPADIAGAKLLKRNLSDIAAMGGKPSVAVLAGFLPANTAISWLKQFVAGLHTCANEWDVAIVGGDLAQTDEFLGFNLTLNGHADRPLLRGAAKQDDLIWVTGELGGSIHNHHAHFQPRLKEGHYLASEIRIHSMIDVTDGLAKDLPTLLSRGLGAEIDLATLPLRGSIQKASDPLAAAFTDGEDYELLFTSSPDWEESLSHQKWDSIFETRLTCIGKVVTRKDSSSPMLDAKTHQPINYGEAYEHFR